VFIGVPESPETAGADVSVGVSETAAVVALADTDVDEAIDIDVDVVVAEDELSVESSLTCDSMDDGSCQPFFLTSNMRRTSLSFPPAITTIPSAP
jgi:hypothetical protein